MFFVFTDVAVDFVFVNGHGVGSQTVHVCSQLAPGGSESVSALNTMSGGSDPSQLPHCSSKELH